MVNYSRLMPEAFEAGASSRHRAATKQQVLDLLFGVCSHSY